KDDQMAALVFMRFQMLCGQRISPCRWKILRNLSALLRTNDAPGDADIADLQLPAEFATRHQQMTGLAGHEGHGVFGTKGRAQYPAAAAIEARGQIDGDDRQIAVSHPRYRGFDFCRNIASKPCPEYGVDDDIARPRLIGVESLACKRA